MNNETVMNDVAEDLNVTALLALAEADEELSVAYVADTRDNSKFAMLAR